MIGVTNNIKDTKKLKYEKQGRFAMGVCMKHNYNPDTNSEDELKGTRLPMFDYSGKSVIAIKKWNSLVANEIRKVKSKSRSEAKSAGWLVSRLPNKIYHNDDVHFLRWCKKKQQ